MSMDKKYTIKYAAVQGFYLAAFCSLLGFTAIFLLDKGYTNSEIGIIIALSNVIAVILQPLIASLADKYKKITLKAIIRVWIFIIFLTCLGLGLLKEASILVSAFITLAIVGILVVQPFINTVSVQLEERGIFVNFGVARACGSLAYAMVSTVMGILLKYYPPALIPFATVILTVGVLGSISILLGEKKVIRGIEKSKKREKDTDATMEKTETTEAQSLVAFLMSHKRFFSFLIGVTFIFYFHALSCNYLFQIIESVGGDSANMGVASAISAVVELPVMILFIKIVQRISCKTLLRISGVFFAIKSILFFAGTSVNMIYVAQLFQVGGYALFVPASVYYVSKLLNRADMVKGQSLVTTAITLGGVFASVATGWILDNYGARTTLFVGAVVAIIGVISMSFSVEDV